MFETLDIMISLGVIFLILSMVHKYLMSMIKRMLKVKATVVANEMKTFVGEKTFGYLVPYLEKKAKHLNFLDDVKKEICENRKQGLRQLSQEQLKEVVVKMREFFESATVDGIKKELNLITDQDTINELKSHLDTLKGRIEHMYDNTLEKISEIYEFKLRYITLFFGMLLAVLINADFFTIYDTLSTNTSVRKNIIDRAEIMDAQILKIDKKLENRKEEVAFKKEVREAREDIAGLQQELTEAGLLLGWTGDKLKELEDPGKLFNKILGLLVSGLLISFGAPFWHDLLSSFLGIKKILRGRGKETRDVSSSRAGTGSWLPR